MEHGETSRNTKPKEIVSRVVESLKTSLKSVDPDPTDCCIYRVPQPLRSVNPKAYTPRVISIGPFHRNTPDLMANRRKSRYLRDLLQFMNIDLYKVVSYLGPVQRVRNCYAETIEMEDADFLELLAIDCSFVVMYLIGSKFPHFRDRDTSFLWRFRNGILCDLLLLENQLPFFLLEQLCQLCISSADELQEVSNFSELAKHYFIEVNKMNFVDNNNDRQGYGIKHFIDLLRMDITGSCSREQPDVYTSLSCTIWPPSATELHDCGISFKKKSRATMHIEFQDGDGVLSLPEIEVSETLEVQLRNLIAYERCHGRHHKTLTDDVCNFAFFLSYLINTEKDVELLINKEIIQNSLGSIEEVTSFFNNLSKNLLVRSNIYHNECESMKSYCRRRRHRWMTSLKRKYFNTPWAAVAFFFTVLITSLTILQAVMAYLNLRRKNRN